MRNWRGRGRPSNWSAPKRKPAAVNRRPASFWRKGTGRRSIWKIDGIDIRLPLLFIVPLAFVGGGILARDGTGALWPQSSVTVTRSGSGGGRAVSKFPPLARSRARGGQEFCTSTFRGTPVAMLNSRRGPMCRKHTQSSSFPLPWGARRPLRRGRGGRSGWSGSHGPNLWGLLDREKASSDPYDYSRTLTRLDGRWSYEELTRFSPIPRNLRRVREWGVFKARKMPATGRASSSSCERTAMLPRHSPNRSGVTWPHSESCPVSSRSSASMNGRRARHPRHARPDDIGPPGDRGSGVDASLARVRVDAYGGV